jgi:hypothetical protein
MALKSINTAVLSDRRVQNLLWGLVYERNPQTHSDLTTVLNELIPAELCRLDGLEYDEAYPIYVGTIVGPLPDTSQPILYRYTINLHTREYFLTDNRADYDEWLSQIPPRLRVGPIAANDDDPQIHS